ncbi:acetyl-CoA carboxylase biotin carboxyl carrier protein [Texcoconibacillus texcoconensis]|uniref:Biotin carboxyl carrier protein of acetyl-CoA carboxylase n=1 Tax=Texcoconibacillus texcoconensis TaxID=1095777 RepID=A0A840QP16_9BACI|nr:acetyl-CoA carboxylase biotin carboxyl carrier protein [Texcoconibacillus texcoconensis]MBB5173073.1 acetyl-CoA carboxylase biotin carboxyl carrier protein [Texcoconibacillus texcoconensis]
MKIQELRELIKLIDDSSIDEFKYEEGGAKVTMRKQVKGAEKQTVVEGVQTVTAAPTTPAAPVPQEERQVEQPTTELKPQNPIQEEPTHSSNEKGIKAITSPMVGTFYQAPSPDSAPYVQVGDHVQENSVVCIVEAMKLMNEIEAEVKGEIVEVLVENGQLVEYGQELFLVRTG